MFPECKYFMSLYKQCFCHRKRRGYSGAEYERFVYMWPVRVCVCVCGPVARHMWQCQCVTAGPLAGEQRLERLPSRVAFVW